VSNQPTPHTEPPDVTSDRTGLGDLARRCRRRTTDLLAIGLLLVVGLALGRQLTAWWNEPELGSSADPDIVAGPGTAWTTPDDLQLGGLGTTIHRRRVRGDRQTVWSALEVSTQNTAREAGWPASKADRAEQQLLAVLDNRESHTSQQATTSLHRLDGPLPVVVAVRRLLGARRIVGWGLATRSTTDDWVTWTFATAGEDAAEPVALPTDSQRLLAVGSGDPEQLLVFSGSPEPRDWWTHFETTLLRGGWTLTASPLQQATGWTARWQHPDGRTMVISARFDNSGKWHGMLNVFTSNRSGSSKTGSPKPGEREST